MIITGEDLTISDIYYIAARAEKVSLDPASLEKVRGAYERLQSWGDAGYPIYGVNTGFGELASVIVPPRYKSELQINLLRSHAAGGGEFFPDEVVRAMMGARLNCLMKGYSGCSEETVLLLQEFLNQGIHPLVPMQGSLGASGDLAPLAHMSLPLIGDGHVRVNTQIKEAGPVLKERGLKPLTLGYKGALTIINGTSAMTGVACLALRRSFDLFRLALLSSADLLQCLRAPSGALDARGHEVKNHSGQIVVAELLRGLLENSKLNQDHHSIMQAVTQKVSGSSEVTNSAIFLQHAYTLRCVPQILGPVLDTLFFCRRIVENELNSCNDNPLVFETPEDTFHGGNFHGQYVAMACDYLNIALCEIGVLAERQLDRLLNPHLNGTLPAFLSYEDSGLFCGFEGGQYLATSIASENLDLAAPSSIKTIPSNGSNQDVVSMGLISARKSLKLGENVATILTCLVSACHQAFHLIGAEKFSPPLRQFHGTLSEFVPLYRDDRPLAELYASVGDFLTGEMGREFLREQVPLGAALD